MLDLRILEFNYKFLKDLELKRKVKCSSIKINAIKRIDPRKTRGIGGSYSNSFGDVSSIASSYPLITTNLKNCEYGDSNSIENLYVENLSLPFPNKFKIYNISGSITIVEDFQLNNYNDEFYKSEIRRFKALMINIFADYTKSYLQFKKYIDDCYVDDCYVDVNYNCPDNEESYSEGSVIYPDLSPVDAGSEPFVSRSSIPSGHTITGATYTYFDGAIIDWQVEYTSGKNRNATFVDNAVLEPVLIEQDTSFDGSSIFSEYTLTLTITYPWGVVMSDTRQLLLVGNY